MNPEENRYSQETHSTSTPLRNRVPLSPYFATSISHFGDSPRSSSLSFSEDSASELSSNQTDEIAEETFLTQNSFDLENFHRVATSSKNWKYFEPFRPETLYCYLFQNPEKIQDTAKSFVSAFEEQEDEINLMLFEFFIGICGYQHIDLSTIDLDLNDNPGIKILQLMETSSMDAELLENRIYIVKEIENNRSKFGQALDSLILSFFDSLLSQAYSCGKLFNLLKVISLIQSFGNSIKIPIRHTGVYLIRRLIQNLNYIYLNLINKSSSSNNSTDEDFIKKLLKRLHITFSKTYFREDRFIWISKMYTARIMLDWMKELPDVYFDKGIAILTTYIEDNKVLVRHQALVVFEKLLKIRAFRSRLKTYINEITTALIDRTQDISKKVFSKAINVVGVLFNQFGDVVPLEVQEKFYELLYVDDYRVASAVGRIFVEFLDSIEIPFKKLFALVKFSNRADKKPLLPIFIESISMEYSDFFNWNLLVGNLCDDKNWSISERVNLMELIYYCVFQKVNGHSIMERKNSPRNPKCNENTHNSLAASFIKNIENLFDLHENNQYMEYLIKTLNLIDYSVVTENYKKEYCLLFVYLLNVLEDEKFDRNLAKIILTFYAEFYNKIKMTENILCDEFDKMYQKLFELVVFAVQGETSWDFPICFKLIIFYKTCNLNNFLSWDVVFSNYTETIEAKNHICLCKCYLIWMIKDFSLKINTAEFKAEETAFKKKFKEFMDFLRAFLSTETNSYGLKIKVFKYICQLYIDVSKYIPIKNDIDFDISKELSKQIGSFFESNVVKNNRILPYKRTKLVANFVQLVINGKLDILYLGPLFHVYYTEYINYGKIINQVCEVMYKENIGLLAVFLADTFSRLLSKQLKNAQELSSKAGLKQINLLTAKYSEMDIFKKPEASAMIQHMIKTTVKIFLPSNEFHALVFYRPFLRHMSSDHILESIEFIKSTIPQKNKSPGSISIFLTELEKASKGKTTKKNAIRFQTKVTKKKKATEKKKNGQKRKIEQESSDDEQSEDLTGTPRKKTKHQKPISNRRVRKGLAFSSEDSDSEIEAEYERALFNSSTEFSDTSVSSITSTVGKISLYEKSNQEEDMSSDDIIE